MSGALRFGQETTMMTTTTTTEMVKTFKAARRVSTPMVAVETPDPHATMVALSGAIPQTAPMFQWDIVRGVSAVNKAGASVLNSLGIDTAVTVNPVSALELCERFPEASVVFFHNAHRQMQAIEVVQAMWNLRDHYKTNFRTLVLLGPDFTLPAELFGDVVVLSESLPTRTELAEILDAQCQNASVPALDAKAKAAALDAVVGLKAYTAEQVIAMSLMPNGIDIAALWQHKVKAVQNTNGLRVIYGGDASLENLQGIDNVKSFMQKLIDANAFSVVVFIDEGDKAMAGGMSDYAGDGGVVKDQVGTILSYIEDTKSLGVMYAGVAGTGKTELAKATAASAGKPLVIFDLGAMRGGLVGESERNIRGALKVITAMAEGRVLFIMTANKTTQFTPEMNRRFPDQFFFDSPDDAGRAAIWPVYIKRAGLSKEQAAFPKGFDAGWTGAEIRRVCERAALFNCTVVEAAKFLVPQSVSGASAIRQLRREASGRFLSASTPGWYTSPEDVTASEPVQPKGRAISMDMSGIAGGKFQS